MHKHTPICVDHVTHRRHVTCVYTDTGSRALASIDHCTHFATYCPPDTHSPNTHTHTHTLKCTHSTHTHCHRSHSLWRNLEMRVPTPHTQAEGRVQTGRAEGSGKEAPAALGRCPGAQAQPKQRAPCPERSLRTRHRVHDLTYTLAVGTAGPSILQKRNGALRGSGTGLQVRGRGRTQAQVCGPISQSQALQDRVRSQENRTATSSQAPASPQPLSSGFGTWVPRKRTG